MDRIRNTVSTLFLAAALLCMGLARPATAQAQDDLGDRVAAIVADMTLEEKVGQMTQVELGVISDSDAPSHRVDPEKLKIAVQDHLVGSILNVAGHSYTVEHWREIISAIQTSAAGTRLGIPVLYGIDAVHGTNYTVGATLFPQNIATAATFDPSLLERMSAVTASETRAGAIPWNFAPVLDIGRQPLWPRFYETFGEDVLLTRRMGEATVRGMQGAPADLDDPGHVAVSAKHYLGYSFPHSGKDRTTALIPDIILREYFLPPFAEAVEAGARTIMVNSGDVNGIPVHGSRYLLTDILRGELGFEGVIVTDWEDIKKLHDVHRVADSQREAVRQSVVAGIDMSMVPYDFSFAEHLAALVRDGEIPESRVDASVRRILRLKLELGLFDDPVLEDARSNDIGSAAASALNLEAARRAVTLLKNVDDLLPIPADARILLTGPAAHSLTALNGGWTYTWQGRDTTYAAHYDDAPTILEAMRERFYDVTYVRGSDFRDPVQNAGAGVEAAAEAARGADIAVIAIGEDAYAEKPGDIDDLTLPDPQKELVAAVARTGTPVLLVLVEGRPRVVTEEVAAARSVVMAYQPGNTGGQAVTDVLSGAVNPSGRLPFTYPRAPNDIVPYDHTNASAQGQTFGGIGKVRGYDPLYPFGHGLSYTTFEYSNLTLDAASIGPDGFVTGSVTIANTGDRAGDHTVLIYVRDLYASVAPPVRRLRDFAHVTLEPGASADVAFRIPAHELAFVGRNSEWTLEPGAFEVLVGGLSAPVSVECVSTPCFLPVN